MGTGWAISNFISKIKYRQGLATLDGPPENGGVNQEIQEIPIGEKGRRDDY